MQDIYDLDASKLRVLRIKLKGGLNFKHLCLDEGDGVWKVEGGICRAHTIRMIRHPKAPYQPKWEDVAREKDVIEHTISNFLDELQ